MTYALVTDGDPTELPHGQAIFVEDVQFSFETMLLWSDEERAAYGIYPITNEAVPDGKIATGSTLTFADDAVTRRWTLQDAPPPSVPSSISDRQFAQVLAMNGLISQEDALAWVKVGSVPEQIQTVVDAIPDDATRFGAQMLLSGATVFERNHPMTDALAAGLGMTTEQVDGIWRAGAAL